MSYGLGKLQRAVLKVLQGGSYEGWVQMGQLAWMAPHLSDYYDKSERRYRFFDRWGEDVWERRYWKEWKVDRTDYIATHRAVTSLEKRGLVETEARPSRDIQGRRLRRTIVYVRAKSVCVSVNSESEVNTYAGG